MPDRRTALVLCGTGAHGAYHAGVLRALQEAGVKIDLAAGQGIGAAAAALAAIDGTARLWEPDGLWRTDTAKRLYRWKPGLRAALWLLGVLLLVLAVPMVVGAAGLAVYVAGFVLTLVGLDAGPALIAWCSGWLLDAFAGDSLPVIVPRLAMLALAALVVAAALGAALERWRAPAPRRSSGRWWWQLAGAPVDASGARSAFLDVVWQLIRGAAASERPAAAMVGTRYAEVLAEGVGQPGFRELLAVATDLDARRDVVVALLRDPYRRAFLASRAGDERRADVLDLAGVGREQAMDVLAAALTPPVVCEPALVAFPVDGYWRGETHRLCDRPAAILRLLQEVAAAGATQVIVVSAVPTGDQPHRLRLPRLDLRHRLGEHLMAAECTALRDALSVAARWFEALYVVRPAHNPAGPFDFGPVYDEASDRLQQLSELVDGGYEDAYRQFIDPIVGASGEQIVRPPAVGLPLDFERL